MPNAVSSEPPFCGEVTIPGDASCRSRPGNAQEVKGALEGQRTPWLLRHGHERCRSASFSCKNIEIPVEVRATLDCELDSFFSAWRRETGHTGYPEDRINPRSPRGGRQMDADQSLA